MGQYYYVVNMSKKEYLHPHKFGDGLKARELSTGYNTMRALAMLLTKSDEGGGGDFTSDKDNIIGSWAGDKIWIVGDYDSSKLYSLCQTPKYKEISEKIIPLLKKEDMWIGENTFGNMKFCPDLMIVNSRGE